MSNNIKFNDNSLFVSYIQSFLRENYSSKLLPSNVYDMQTHEALINYLEQPNVKEMMDAEKDYKSEFSELNTLFTLERTSDSLIFTSKAINKTTSDFISENLDRLKDLSYSIGWEISDYNSYIDYTLDINEDNSVDNIDRKLLQVYLETKTGLSDRQKKRADFNVDGVIDEEDYNTLLDFIYNHKLYIVFKKQDRINFFPNKDMLKFINLFSNDYYFYKAIRDGEGPDDFVHDSYSGKYKICVIKCKPGTTYTISHSSGITQRLVIGSMTSNKRNLSVSKILNVVDVNVSPGNAITYKTSSASDSNTSRDAQYILIQCSSNIEDYSSLQEVVIPLKLGDINLDGNIDLADRKILADYLFYHEGDKRRPTLTRKQLAACDIDNDGKITNKDLERLVEYLNGDRVSLGTIEYKYYIPREINELNNVASLLVIEGNMIEEYTGETQKCEVDIFHEEERTDLFTQNHTYTDLSNIITIDFDYDPPVDDYDNIIYKLEITEIEGNTKVDYFDSTNTISPDTPLQTSNIVDLSFFINNNLSKPIDLSQEKLCKVNDIYDKIYQQKDKYFYEKKIEEVFSDKLSWSRHTTDNGYAYLRSNITELKPISNNLTANIISNKFNIVSTDDILNEIFTYNYEISIDNYGRICLYSKDIDGLQEQEMLSWLVNNKFYILGELKNIVIREVGLEIPDLLLKPENEVIANSDSCLPTKISLVSKVVGVIESYMEQIVSSFPVTKSTIGLNFLSFTNDPWIVHHKFISYLLGQSITPYSRSEDITYVQNLIGDLYPTYKDTFVPGIYTDKLRELVEQFQRKYTHYDKGDLNVDSQIDLIDIKMLEDYLNGEGELSQTQLLLADVNSDTIVDGSDLNAMYKEYRGVNDYLKTFDIEFIFGYVDPQTECKMEKILSRKLDRSKPIVGWNDKRCH